MFRRFIRVLDCECAQCPPGADFEKNLSGVFQQCLHTVGKAHCLAQMFCPVVRVCRLFRGDPGSGDIGQIRDLRGTETDMPDLLGERNHDRLCHL